MTQCYMCDLMSSNSMKSANPHSGFHPITAWPCLDTSPQNPVRNQGGGYYRVLAVQTAHTRQNGKGYGEWEVSYTLNLANDFAVMVEKMK